MSNENIDKHMLKTRFPLECERLPWEYLEENEKILAEKCINHEELTSEELADLKLLLNNYRPFLKKYDIKQAEENIETTDNIIRTQSQLLELLHDEKRYRIDMNYWMNGKKYLLKFKVKPFTDKQYLEGIGSQLGIFRDLNKNEKILINKANNNEPLSPEEEKMHQSIIDKINEKLEDDESQMELMNKFLADRLDFIDDEKLSFEEKLEFWETIELTYRVSLFNRVKGILQFNDTFEEELFPPVG